MASNPGAGSAGIVAIIAAILLPPLGVFLREGLSTAFWVDVLLTVLAWLPGVIFALVAAAAGPAAARLAEARAALRLAERRTQQLGRAMSFPLPPPMRLALDLARDAAAGGEVPVGAVVMAGERIVATSANRMRGAFDPTAHAEIVAIRAAAECLAESRLDGCDLWVTLEPCAMCTGAIALARVRRLYFGAVDIKGGAVVSGPRLFAQPTCHHRPEVYPGIGESESGALLRAFFAERR